MPLKIQGKSFKKESRPAPSLQTILARAAALGKHVRNSFSFGENDDDEAGDDEDEQSGTGRQGKQRAKERHLTCAHKTRRRTTKTKNINDADDVNGEDHFPICRPQVTDLLFIECCVYLYITHTVYLPSLKYIHPLTAISKFSCFFTSSERWKI